MDKTLLLLNFLLTLAPLQAEEATPPNVVIFLADDQAWGDLGVNGDANLATPNIDSLARDGVTLQNFYVCHVCAAFMGRAWQWKSGRYLQILSRLRS